VPQKSVHFVSLGCPKNRVDTEVMLGLVAAEGYQLVPEPDGADLIVVNTCGFIGEAKEESIDTILEMARFKAAGTCERLVVTGCLSQRYPEELAREMPEVDQFLGSGDFPKITGALRGDGPRVDVSRTPRYLYDELTPRTASLPAHTAYVKISEGCDRPCSFCIIPKLRGPQRSRTPESLEREVHDHVARGAREVILVAQDLTDYGSDLPPSERISLAALVRRLARTPNLRWLRLHYAYPSETDDALLDAVADEPTVVKYVDMPLQHADDAVLKSMRRGYGARLVREMVAKVRARIPGVTFRTTFIVGHPGETEDAFNRLCDFVDEVELDRVGVFTFSREEGTVAAMLPRRVTKEVAEKRRREIMRRQRLVSLRKMKALVGTDLEVLVEGPSEESDLLLKGRHAGQAPDIDGQVVLTDWDGKVKAGDLVRARVTKAGEYDLVASLASA
jgi:ribosomal protein S12 methylthiotransferase